MMDGLTFMWPATPHQAGSFATSTTGRSAKRPSSVESHSAKMEWSKQGWASGWAISISMAVWIFLKPTSQTTRMYFIATMAKETLTMSPYAQVWELKLVTWDGE